MSGKNKVNPDHYKVAGRLSQDDLARARRTQSEPLFGATRSRQNKPLPPWMVNDQLGRQGAEDEGGAAGAAIDDGEATEPKPQAKAKRKPRPKAKTSQAAKRAATSAKSAKKKSPAAQKTAKSRKTPQPRVSAAKGGSRKAKKKTR